MKNIKILLACLTAIGSAVIYLVFYSKDRYDENAIGLEYFSDRERL